MEIHKVQPPKNTCYFPANGNTPLLQVMTPVLCTWTSLGPGITHSHPYHLAYQNSLQNETVSRI